MCDPGTIVAGVDGGATRTRAVIMRADGTIAGFGLGGPSNYDNIGVASAAANIRDAVAAARRNAGGVTSPLASIFLGMAGVVSPADRATVAQMVVDHGVASPGSIGVDHDIRIALAGGLEGREGIVLIAGTGSSTYGRRSDGRHHRTGWGYLLDDQGSGYYLGLQAMIAAVQEADGRGRTTVLSAAVRSRLGFRDIDDIMRILYHDGVSVARIASLAPEVVRAASSGDGVAGSILAAGAHELARMVETVARRLEFIGRSFPFTMVGGLVDHPGPYRDLVTSEVRTMVPDAVIREPALPPVIGAALCALEFAGVPRGEALYASLREQVRSLAPSWESGDSNGVHHTT